MRESQDSDEFWSTHAQVQSHAMLCRGFGTSVPFIWCVIVDLWWLISIRCCCAYNGAEAEVCVPYMQLVTHICIHCRNCATVSVTAFCFSFYHLVYHFYHLVYHHFVYHFYHLVYHLLYHFVYHRVSHFVWYFAYVCVGYPSTHQWSWCNGVHTSCSDEAHAERDSRPEQPALPCEHMSASVLCDFVLCSKYGKHSLDIVTWQCM